MRRWSGLLAALSLLAVVGVGCHHTAGVCDCCNCGGNAGLDGPPVGVVASGSVMPHAPISYPPGAWINRQSTESATDSVTVHMPTPVFQGGQ